MRAVLDDLRGAIRETSPEAVERIRYRIPTHTCHGPPALFAADRDHASFIVVNRSVLETFRAELAGFGTSGTIHIKAGHPFPTPLVARIVRLRMERNEPHSPHRRKMARVAPDGKTP